MEVIGDSRQRRMIQFCEQARLACELAPQPLVRGKTFFQRYGDIQTPVDSFVNRAHASAAEPLNQTVATLQNGASWQERRPGVGVKRFLHLRNGWRQRYPLRSNGLDGN